MDYFVVDERLEKETQFKMFACILLHIFEIGQILLNCNYLHDRIYKFNRITY